MTVATERASRIPPAEFPVTVKDLVWLTLVATIYIAFWLTFWAVVEARGLDVKELATDHAFYFAGATLQSFLIVACVYFFVMRRHGLDWPALGFRSVSKRWFVYAVLIALICVPAAALFTILILSLINWPIANSMKWMIVPEGWFEIVGYSVIVAILAPFGEELAFRGVLYRFLRKYWSVPLAALVSASVFGLVHIYMELIPAAVFMGLVTAVAYEKSGSLWVPVTIHAVYNGIWLTSME